MLDDEVSGNGELLPLNARRRAASKRSGIREFAVNGLDEHFHHNVMGGERLREAARRAVTAARRSELRWETGQPVPALEAAGQPHRRGPDLLC